MKLSFGTGLKFNSESMERAEKLMKTVKQATKPSEFISVQAANAQNQPDYKTITGAEEEAYRVANGLILEEYDAGPTMKTFGELVDRYSAPKALLENVARQNWINPSYCQQCAIPAVMQGVNSVCQAPTGSGKTAAYLLPIIMRAVRSADTSFHVLEPSEELCAQVQQLLQLLTENITLSATCKITVQMPGQLVKALAEPRQEGVKYVLVLDECDLLIKRHEKRVNQLLRLLTEGQTRPELHLFSASISADVRYIASTFLGRPARIGIKQPYENISHRFAYVRNPQHKAFMLSQHLLKQIPPILVFCADPEKTRQQVKLSIPSASLDDRLSLEEKQRVLNAFEQQKIWCLFASDKVARGVDFKGLQLVIQYDPPGSVEDYVHRCGRAGRQFKGCSLCFFQDEDRAVLDKVRQLLADAKAPVHGYSTQEEVDAFRKASLLAKEKARAKKKTTPREDEGMEGKLITQENIDEELYASLPDSEEDA